jgi:hypothetical protein
MTFGVYDENYCYDSGNRRELMEEISKLSVEINDLYMRGSGDGVNGCTGTKPKM